MSASSDKGTGSEYVVDAASQFAHAISVNRATWKTIIMRLLTTATTRAAPA